MRSEVGSEGAFIGLVTGLIFKGFVPLCSGDCGGGEGREEGVLVGGGGAIGRLVAFWCGRFPAVEACCSAPALSFEGFNFTLIQELSSPLQYLLLVGRFCSV